MRIPTLISILILHIVVGSNCLAQLVADAGNDTAVCEDIVTLSIGGNPTAKGGVPPYTYTWSGSCNLSYLIFTASFMLEDTTVANPVFKERAIPESVVLYVTVKDANDSVAIDSISVRKSGFGAYLGECRHYISLGDSVQLGHGVFGGIPPYSFSWTPTESLSDSTIENPWAKPNSFLTYYTLEITDSIGCKTWSFCKVYTEALNRPIKEEQSNIQIYPNPISDRSVIEWTQSFQPVQMNVYDLTGRIIYSKVIIDSESSYIDRSDLEKGVLVLEIVDNKGKGFKQQIIVL